MAWMVPLYDREQVNRAGRTRIDLLVSPEARDIALGPINNWRSAHSFPLNSIQMTLRRRARTVAESAVVAQRLKRLIAIESKLLRFPDMKLTQMQDIGGCRAILPTVTHVERLVKLYERSTAKNPTGRHPRASYDDYIAKPKADGYRGVHLVYRYFSESKKHRPYNDLKIEIQLRSRPQHAWATAVETVDMFTGQALKSDRGQQDWTRFFALMGSAIARRERRPPVPDTPPNQGELVKELRELAQKLQVVRKLDTWRHSLKRWTPKTSGVFLYLVYLDVNRPVFEIVPFRFGDLAAAQAAYANAEKRVEENPGSQAVLVSVEDLTLLRRAYPNYFLDTRLFLLEVQRAIA
jgi:hypothetical protein